MHAKHFLFYRIVPNWRNVRSVSWYVHRPECFISAYLTVKLDVNVYEIVERALFYRWYS